MPKPLFTKLVAQGAIGFFCVLLGCVYGIHTQDKIFVMLSILIGVGSSIRLVSLVHMIHSKSYRILIGTCVKKETGLFRKTQQILFRDSDGKEYQFTLGKNVKLLLGHNYCLYFRTDVSHDNGNVNLSQGFLGYEEIPSLR